MFGIDNLPKRADPILTAFKYIFVNLRNADELHICSIPVSIFSFFNTATQSINLLNCSCASFPFPKNANEKCENVPSICILFHCLIFSTIFSFSLYINPYLPNPVSIFR